jgi:beta-glucosidase-like glycosyl hydrolase
MSDDLMARLEAESYWEPTDYGKLRVVPYSLALAAITAERQAREQAEQALAAGWDAETVKRQVADFNALCDAARGYRERAEQAEQDRQHLLDTCVPVEELRQAERRAEAAWERHRASVEQAEQERYRLRAELRNIAEAQPSTWDEPVRDQFQQWAQSRARYALAPQDGQP